MRQADTLSDTATGLAFDLRRIPPGPETGDAFLGNLLRVSHHPQWQCWRASGTDLSGRFDGGRRHLLVIVLKGRLSLHDDATATDLQAGDSAWIAPGTRFAWQAHGPALWVVNGCAGPAAKVSAEPGITPIRRDTEQLASPPPAARVLVGPAPDCTKRELAATADGCWSAGLWSATPYERIPLRYGYYEMMHLHAGSVTLFDTAGATVTFRQGDLFMIPEGVTAGWRSTVPVRKLFSIFTPATP